jgi:hypothetical protein
MGALGERFVTRDRLERIGPSGAYVASIWRFLAPELREAITTMVDDPIGYGTARHEDFPGESKKHGPLMEDEQNWLENWLYWASAKQYTRN